ncbi:GNAT family N-acetyltransferase [Clostridium felsineum]|uniref:GNAT family N-acetyltransferase n=1 Tax=Clostridium felsineum TaxID=36839 RepID=UPI00214DD9FB|nr:GNAT family N-acetyltransferase [Clostridium felsineum]MCR3760860.1 GNAT family N-acetyltransferase [Clostridium felsineum]
MSPTIQLGTINDIDELELLYNDLNDYLASEINYPGWIKGVYPVKQNAIDGIKNGNLYIAKYHGKIVGSLILSHKPEPAYYNVKWSFESDYSDVFIIYTFVVHPKFLRQGIGESLIDFSTKYSIKNHAKAVRLDVYEKNSPAIKLYEKCGFNYVSSVDLGLSHYGLDVFRLYEKIL